MSESYRIQIFKGRGEVDAAYEGIVEPSEVWGRILFYVEGHDGQ